MCHLILPEFAFKKIISIRKVWDNELNEIARKDRFIKSCENSISWCFGGESQDEKTNNIYFERRFLPIVILRKLIDESAQNIRNFFILLSCYCLVKVLNQGVVCLSQNKFFKFHFFHWYHCSFNCFLIGLLDWLQQLRRYVINWNYFRSFFLSTNTLIWGLNK